MKITILCDFTPKCYNENVEISCSAIFHCFYQFFSKNFTKNINFLKVQSTPNLILETFSDFEDSNIFSTQNCVTKRHT